MNRLPLEDSATRRSALHWSGRCAGLVTVLLLAGAAMGLVAFLFHVALWFASLDTNEALRVLEQFAGGSVLS